MLKKIFFRLLAASLAVAAAATLGEVVLRLTPGGAPKRDVAIVDRTPPTAESKPHFRRGRPDFGAEGFRIVFVGDSFTWGDGVWPEDAYPARVERRLATADAERPLQVISWSRPGWNTRLEWQSFKAAEELLAPDVVVLGYCLNDAEPSKTERRRRLWREEGWWPGDEPPPSWLTRHSLLAARIRASLLNLRSRRTARTYYYRIYDDNSAWRQNRRALLKFGELGSRAKGPRFLLVIFPIFDSQLDRRYPYRDLHRRIVALAEENEIAVLDLLPIYEGVDARRLAVEPFTDPHPNELAHRMAADRIAEELVSRGWLPESGPDTPSPAPSSAIGPQ